MKNWLGNQGMQEDFDLSQFDFSKDDFFKAIQFSTGLIQLVKTLKEENEELKEKNVGLKQLLESVHVKKKQITTKEAPVSTFSELAQPLVTKQALLALDQVNSSSWINVAELRSELNKCQEDVVWLKEERSKNELLILEFQKKNEQLQGQLDSARETMKSLRSKYSHLEEMLDEKNNSCTELESTLSEYQRELESLNIYWNEKQFANELMINELRETLSNIESENLYLSHHNDELSLALEEIQEKYSEHERSSVTKSSSPQETLSESVNRMSVERVNNHQSAVSDELNVMIELVSGRFTEHMRTLEEQLIHSEYHTVNNSVAGQVDTPLKEYFKLLTLSIKILLSSSGRYDTIWYHIWFIDSDYLYKKVLLNSVSWHKWYSWIWCECVTLLDMENKKSEFKCS